jgi:hypothetical protein
LPVGDDRRAGAGRFGHQTQLTDVGPTDLLIGVVAAVEGVEADKNDLVERADREAGEVGHARLGEDADRPVEAAAAGDPQSGELAGHQVLGRGEVRDALLDEVDHLVGDGPPSRSFPAGR